MTLRDSWIYAGKQPKKIEKLPVRIVTEGMSDSDAPGAPVYFAQAVRTADGTYTINYSRYAGQQGFGHDPGPQAETVLEALEILEEWESRHRGFYSYHNLDIGLDRESERHTKHYREVARDMGVALGAEAVSLRHAESLKRTAMKRTR